LSCHSDVEGLTKMYISLADSRAKGFMKWADTYQPESRGDASAGADEHRVTAAAGRDHVPEFQIPAAPPVGGQDDIWDVGAGGSER
jgi:hypothetical protein